ncbi:unnamed protein product [Symbiodinium sp. CCMP2592]|nr:unnamed protein product [Symbiodinium sp. CCMP2592]
MSKGLTLRPLIPLFLLGILLIWVGSGEVPTSISVWERGQDRHVGKGPPRSEPTLAPQREAGQEQDSPEDPNRQSQTKPGKGRGKQEGTAAAQVTRIDFGLPQSVVASLQAIAARSTQDLWSSPAAAASDLTIEQQHSRQASASYKLSKRIAGNSKAKEDLAVALAEWAGTIGLHLAGLIQRVKALGDKIDEDLRAACQEMETTLADLPSSTTAERIQAAHSKLGPVWTPPQVDEIVRIASALRAFSVVPGAATSSGDGHSAVLGTSLGHTSTISTPLREFSALSGVLGTSPISGTSGPLLVAGPARNLESMDPSAWPGTTGAEDAGRDTGATGSRQRRWKRGNVALPHRPSKSPRREESGGPPSVSERSLEPPPTPWLRGTTGRTPETTHRPSFTEVTDDVELWPDPAPEGPVSWLTAWRRAAQFCCAHGSEKIGEVAADVEQDAIWPLHLGTEAAVLSAQAETEAFWAALPHAISEATEVTSADLVATCQDLLQKLRLCPSALPGTRQGVVVLIQATLGNLMHYQQYGPATAQEWLYPSLLLEHGATCQGILPTQLAECMRPLLRIPGPLLSGSMPSADGAL